MYVLGPATAATWKGPSHRGVQQLLGPQHHLVAHLKGRVHPAPIQRRIGAGRKQKQFRSMMKGLLTIFSLAALFIARSLDGS